MAAKKKVEEVVEEEVEEVVDPRPLTVVDSHTVARLGVEDPDPKV